MQIQDLFPIQNIYRKKNKLEFLLKVWEIEGIVSPLQAEKMIRLSILCYNRLWLYIIEILFSIVNKLMLVSLLNYDVQDC